MSTQDLNNMMVVSCSGASNTGCYADTVARKLSSRGQADMVCLPKIAIDDNDLIEKLKTTTKRVVVLDGCPINCAQKILNDKGIENFTHVNTTDFGIVKGKTAVTEDKIEKIIESLHDAS